MSAVESDCLESGGYRADYIEDLEYKFARWSHDHGTYPSVGRAKAFEQGYGECHGLAGTCRGQECNGVASGFYRCHAFLHSVEFGDGEAGGDV